MRNEVDLRVPIIIKAPWGFKSRDKEDNSRAWPVQDVGSKNNTWYLTICRLEGIWQLGCRGIGRSGGKERLSLDAGAGWSPSKGLQNLNLQGFWVTVTAPIGKMHSSEHHTLHLLQKRHKSVSFLGPKLNGEADGQVLHLGH